MVSDGRSIPILDIKAQYPEGLKVRERTAWFMEFFVGYLYRNFSPLRKIPFDRYVRLFVPLFTSISILAVFLTASELFRNKAAAAVSSLFYAVALPAVNRNLGFAFLKEHFALPFIFFHIYFFLSSLKEGKRYRILFSGLCLLLAMGAWHLTQFYLMLLVLYLIFRLFWREEVSFLYQNFGILTVFALLAGLTIPYLRDSLFIFSYTMLLSYSLLLTWALMRYRRFSVRQSFLVFLISFLTPALLVYVLSVHGRVYSHVYSLIFYKIRFLGRKPADPGLLPFEARLYWFPDWTSPTLGYTLTGFLTLFLVDLIPLGQAIRKFVKRRATFCQELLLYFMFTFFIFYLLFQRLEIVLVFFLATFAGGLILIWQKNRVLRILSCSLLCLALLFEAGGTVNGVSTNDYYYLGELFNWVRENIGKDDVILSPLSPSSEVLTYTGRPIVLHTFLESVDNRRKIEEFAYSLFAEGEEKLYQFCQKNQVNYLIIPKGTYTDTGPYSTAYLTDNLELNHLPIIARLDPPGQAQGTWNLEYAGQQYRARVGVEPLPQGLEKFKLVFRNRRYRVYKVYQWEEIEKAKEHYAVGKGYLQRGEYAKASKELEKAIALYPNLADAYYDLALAYHRMGDEKQAIRFLRKVRSWRPENLSINVDKLAE